MQICLVQLGLSGHGKICGMIAGALMEVRICNSRLEGGCQGLRLIVKAACESKVRNCNVVASLHSCIVSHGISLFLHLQLEAATSRHHQKGSGCRNSVGLYCLATGTGLRSP